MKYFSYKILGFMLPPFCSSPQSRRGCATEGAFHSNQNPGTFKMKANGAKFSLASLREMRTIQPKTPGWKSNRVEIFGKKFPKISVYPRKFKPGFFIEWKAPKAVLFPWKLLKILFISPTEISGNANRNVWLNGKHPADFLTCCK